MEILRKEKNMKIRIQTLFTVPCCLLISAGVIAWAAEQEEPTKNQNENVKTVEEEGYQPLFTGEDLSGWTIQWKGNWEVNDGVIVGRQDVVEKGDSWLFTEDAWADFILKLEFHITPEGNSGVGIRMPKGVEGRPSQYGYEIQINDSDDQFPTGSIFRHVAASPKVHKMGEWNEMTIEAKGPGIIVHVNGEKVIDASVENTREGRIGLQVHGGEEYKDQVVQFRNIRIKPLVEE
jgi:hypothetical protein